MQSAESSAAPTDPGFDLATSLQAATSEVVGWVEATIRALPEILAALILFVAFLFLARAVRKMVGGVMSKVTDHGPLRGLAENGSYVAVVGLGIFVALGVLQLDTVLTSALAGVGIVGLALGFAFQDVAKNFVSGIMISLRRPFTDGDLIETNDYFGVVEGVDLRATRIRTLQGQLVRVPNGSVFSDPIVNYDQAEGRRIDVACGTSYGDDLEKAKRVALEAISKIDGQLDRDPELFYTGFGGSSIDFVVRFWIRDTGERAFLAARSEAITGIKKAFDENDVGIPFPIMTLDFSDAGTRRIDEPLQLLRGES